MHWTKNPGATPLALRQCNEFSATLHSHLGDTPKFPFESIPNMLLVSIPHQLPILTVRSGLNTVSIPRQVMENLLLELNTFSSMDLDDTHLRKNKKASAALREIYIVPSQICLQSGSFATRGRNQPLAHFQREIVSTRLATDSVIWLLSPATSSSPF